MRITVRQFISDFKQHEETPYAVEIKRRGKEDVHFFGDSHSRDEFTQGVLAGLEWAGYKVSTTPSTGMACHKWLASN